MSHSCLLDEPRDECTLALSGLESDNLLSFLALMGLLRALEEYVPHWQPRVSWAGPPWTARLHLAKPADHASVAMAARAGIHALIQHYDVGDKTDVNFSVDEFRFDGMRTRTSDMPFEPTIPATKVPREPYTAPISSPRSVYCRLPFSRLNTANGREASFA